jgi:hypothetical protein
MRQIVKLAVAAAGALSLGLAVGAAAQGNDNENTPLNSRIRRDRAFPTDLAPRFDREQVGRATRERGRDVFSQFSSCLYNRSRTGSLELLGKTDFGFMSFEQVGLEMDRAVRTYGFRDCLNRTASNKGMNIALRFTPTALRQWLVQEAYLDRFPDGAEWVKPGHAVAERRYPLSGNDRSVRLAMDFADCVVVASPYNADWFYRTVAGAPGEAEAINALAPALGPCLPAGQTVELSPGALRVWLGEALWHAALNNAPAAAQPE